MRIFSKRPLALSCFFLILSALLTYYLNNFFVFLPIVLGFAGLAFFLVFRFRRKKTYRDLLIVLLLIATFLGSGRVLFEVLPARLLTEKTGTEGEVIFTVRETQPVNDFRTRIYGTVSSFNGEKIGCRAVMLCEFYLPLYSGDQISGKVSVQDLSFDNYYEGEEFTYRAEGSQVLLYAETSDSFSLIKTGKRNFPDILSGWRDRLSFLFAQRIGGEAGKLVSAMLLGTKNELSETTVRDFRRCGVSHILALSGLHLGILAAISDRVLSCIHIGKKFRIPAVLLLMLIYLFMTGCTYSMLRSFLMLSLVYLSFSLKAEQDAATLLFTAAALIVLITPFAVFSTSFQMTVLATFGILTLGQSLSLLCRRIPVGKGWRRPFGLLLRYLAVSFLISVAASVAVLPIQWITFGEFSLLSPISNLIFIPVLPVLLVGGLLTLSAFPTALFGFLTGKIANFLLLVSSGLSSLHGVISLRYRFVPYILIPFLIILLLFLLTDWKKKKIFILIPTAVMIVSFAVCMIFPRIYMWNTLELTYRRAGENEAFLFSSSEGAVIIDISNGSVTQSRENFLMLQDEGGTEIEMLVFTHYHTLQPSTIQKFGSEVLIRNLLIPQPGTPEEENIFSELKSIGDSLGIHVDSYAYCSEQTLPGKVTMTLLEPIYEERSVQPALRLEIQYFKETVRYDSSVVSEYLRNLGEPIPAVDADWYLLGAHGPVPHEPVEFSVAKEATDIAVLAAKPDKLLPIADEKAISYTPLPEKFRIVLKNSV